MQQWPFLGDERGLSAGTVGLYAGVASRFVANLDRCGVGLDVLEAGDVTRFVVAESQRRSLASVKNVVTGLRSFLRFLFVTGQVPRRLDDAVPSVAG